MEMARDGGILQLESGRVLGYAEFGDPAGTPIVAFHGTPGSRLLLGATDRAAQQANARIVAPDRPGYGRSQPHGGGSLLGYQEDVLRLADALGIDTFSVMGLSGGGPYALACASRVPQRVRLAALISGIGPLSLPGSTKDMVASNRLIFSLGRLSPHLSGLLVALLLRLTLPALEKHVRRGTSPSPDISPEMLAVLAADQREAIRGGGTGVRYDMQAYWRPWGFELEELRTRLYLWHGATDNLAPVRLARYVAEHVPDCTATFYPGEGHTGPITNHLPEIMNQIVEAATQGG